ncbi:MAG: hypothetical protein EXQ75_04730 [Candidatus Planktophila sp.]|jgi:hypothetical protein|nr:hypothetical protein [Candidatus Planktophila sp.]
MPISRKKVVIAISIFAIAAMEIAPASAKYLVSGSFGQSISVTKSTLEVSKKVQMVTVNGKGFDETIGIYLAYCVVPKPGAAPTPCGGGANKAGIGGASTWISSNAPAYGAGLAIAFKGGGRFSEKLSITKMIGKSDCTKVKCAITVRSDHLHEGDRTNDLFIPITFKNK